MKRQRALVVDDEPDIRELLGITLERMNVEVITASDVAGATREFTLFLYTTLFRSRKSVV